MPRPGGCQARIAHLLILILLSVSPAALADPENKRCLTREQLDIEPVFSACPSLVDEASVSDSSFIAKLYINGGPSRYTMRWRGQNYYNEDVFTYNEATGLYDGFCATRACSIGPGGWVQMEHWDYFVGTLLAEHAGTWTYEELHDDQVFQSRTFEVKELSLEALSGTNQMGVVGQSLPFPLVLKLSSFEGIGIEDEVIGWSMDGPRGAKGAAVYGIGSGSETDAGGVDSATVRLGSKPGAYTVTLNNRRVTAASQPSLTFTAIEDIEDLAPDQDHPDVEEGVGENRGQQCDYVGNPVALSTGNKFQREIDLESNGLSPIEFVRYHNSLGFVSKSFVNYWTHSYDRYIEFPEDSHAQAVKVIRPDGKKIRFDWNGGGFAAQPGVHATLEELSGGWRFVDEDNTTERFDTSGLLVEIEDRYGRVQTVHYDSRERLSRVEDGLGGRLDFRYDGAGRLEGVTDQAGRTWSFSYEALGRLSQVEKPDGTTRGYHYEDLRHPYALTGITIEDGQRFAWYEYDEQGRATASWHAADADRVDIRYETNGDRVVLDPRGNATVYQTRIENRRGVLDGISGPICSQGCGQTDTQYLYDENLNVTSKTVYGVTTLFGDYDSRGQPGYVVEAAGTVNEKRSDYEYDPRFHGRATRITGPSVYPGKLRVTDRAYDAYGNLARETVSGFDAHGQPVARSISNAFDGPYGQISASNGPREDVDDSTTFEYYPDDPAEGFNRARLRSVVDPNGIRTRDAIVYSSTGKVLTEVRPNGVVLDYEYYDGSDRIRAITESAGPLFNRTQWAYYPSGDVMRITIDDEAGNAIITQLSYDGARRLRRIESRVSSGRVFSADQWVTFAFDAAGNVITETRESRDTPGKALVIQRVFDAYDRLDSLIQGGVEQRFEYNPNGTLASQTDGEQGVTDYSYDEFRRLTGTSRLGQVTTTFDYDVHGNTLAFTDPQGHRTEYLYDDLGNRIRQASPDSGVSTYAYNGSGLVVSREDAEGQLTVRSYDAGGRLTAIDHEGTAYDVTYAFDNCSNGSGRLCTVTTGWGHTTRYEWNALGELASITTDEGTLSYTFGPLNTVTSMRYPSGRVVSFTIDGGGLPEQIRLQSDAATESILVDDIRYSPLGRAVSWQSANGLKTTVDLDARHRPTVIDVAGIWQWRADTYDANGNILNLEQGMESIAYSYDGLDRLTGAEGNAWSIAYTWHDAGNRLSRTSGGAGETARYESGSNRLASQGDQQFMLDANGSITGFTVNGSPGTSYRYSTHGRLVEVVDDAATASVATYRYDGLGQRVRKTGETGTRRFVYGLNGELLAELDGAGRILHEYVYLDGRPVVDLHELPEPSSTPAVSEIILDDGDATVSGANWQRKSDASAVGGTFLQNRKRDDRAIYWYIDQAGFPGGSHDVFIRWLQPDGEGSSTVYQVKVSGQSSQRIVVDHSAHRSGEWVLLGNFDFAAAGAQPAQYVALTGFDNRDGSEGTFLEADAIRLIPTGVQEDASGIKFIHGDHLGTPHSVTDLSARIIWSASYRPFGAAVANEDPDSDGESYALNLRFPGHYFDQESNLHYNYFRTYSPALGRYIESDPMGLAGGANAFLYASANPTRFIDPLGLMVRGEWIESPRFNLQESGINGWDFVAPSFSEWGYLDFIRLHGYAAGFINIDVRCSENCEEWEVHDRVTVSARGSFDVGPNLYALGTGFITRNPFAGVGANMALGGAALLQAELHFLNLAREKAGPLIAALLADGPTLICLGSAYDD